MEALSMLPVQSQESLNIVCSLITESPYPLDISISVLHRKVNLTNPVKKQLMVK
jgi:hypothetical protein